MRERRAFSSTVNKELNRSELTDCTLAFIVFSNNIKHSLIQLAVQKESWGLVHFWGQSAVLSSDTLW